MVGHDVDREFRIICQRLEAGTADLLCFLYCNLSHGIAFTSTLLEGEGREGHSGFSTATLKPEVGQPTGNVRLDPLQPSFMAC